jgi:predicted  nucleic acid-binding Zn-ribbon protein
MYSATNKLVNPQNLTDKLNLLNQQLPSILDDYNKYFVLYNKSPDNNEYQQSFDRIQGNLNELNSQLFMLSNEVQFNTNDINKMLTELNSKITIEKNKNAKFKKELGNIENENNATTEMIINYTEMYNNGYLRNWGLLLSIVIAGFAISKVYSSKVVIPTPK